MVTVSLCMIVKNEEAVLERCLETIHDIVDEINILDTGSTDRTKEIAAKYTDRIFHHKWSGNFAEARNKSHKYATKEYIMWLDADDVILEADRQRLKELKETLDPSVDSVSMFYDADTDAFGNVIIRYRRNRWVRRDRNFQWNGEAHAYLHVSGKVINADISVTHKKLKHSVGRNLSIYRDKKKRGDRFDERDYYYFGNELRENKFYEEAIEAYDKNIAIKKGWSEDKFNSCVNKADCYRALEKYDEELLSLLQSIVYTGKPRAEASSRIGFNYHRKKEYANAVFWYELAIQQKPDNDQWGFSYPAYSTWYPHLQLCVCYYRLGDVQKSYEHNEMAAKYRPEDPSVIFNRDLLRKELQLEEAKEEDASGAPVKKDNDTPVKDEKETVEEKVTDQKVATEEIQEAKATKAKEKKAKREAKKPKDL